MILMNKSTEEAREFFFIQTIKESLEKKLFFELDLVRAETSFFTSFARAD